MKDVSDDKRHNPPKYGTHRHFRDTFDDIDIYTYRRCDQTHLCYSHHKNAEPYWIEIQSCNHREEDRH